MEVTIALGLFCDTHGPCVILCTDRVAEIPEHKSFPNIPICDACQSIDLHTIYSCKDDDSFYISTRNPLTKNVANSLKDAVLRSLSVEVQFLFQSSLYYAIHAYILDCSRTL